MIKAIIFDCWGTLFYAEKKFFSSVAKKLGKDPRDYDFLKLFERNFMLSKYENLKEPLSNLLEDMGREVKKEKVDELKEIINDSLCSQKAYPDTIPTLNELNEDYKLGMVTNTDYRSFKCLEDTFDIGEIFDVILKPYEIKALKPNPKVFKIVLEEMDVGKDKALMVGDSLPDDVKAAKQFGMKAVLIDRRNRYPNYEKRIESLSELKSMKYLQ